jgi:hypothetical protein
MKLDIRVFSVYGSKFNQHNLCKGLITGNIEVQMRHRHDTISIYTR